MDKKGQLDAPIITFAVALIAILIITPIILYIHNSILNPIQTALGGQSPAINATITSQINSLNNFWDFTILMAFVALILILFLTAFFIDVSPLFFVFYMITGFIMFIILPSITDALGNLYSISGAFNSTLTHLPYAIFLQEHLFIILLVVYAISAIIMYGKLQLTRGGSI